MASYLKHLKLTAVFGAGLFACFAFGANTYEGYNKNTMAFEFSKTSSLNTQSIQFGTHSLVESQPYRPAAPNQVFYIGSDYAADPFELPEFSFDRRGPLETVNYNRINDTWSSFNISELSVSDSTELQVSDGFSMVVSTGVSYQINPGLKFNLGLLAADNLANDIAFPVLGIDWSITDRLNLRTLDGAYLTYDLTDDKSTQLDVSVRYHHRDFSVSNLQGTVFMGSEGQTGTLTESALIGTVGLKRQWKDVFSIRAFAEFMTEQELQLNESQEEAQKIDTEDTISFGVEGGIRF